MTVTAEPDTSAPSASVAKPPTPSRDPTTAPTVTPQPTPSPTSPPEADWAIVKRANPLANKLILKVVLDEKVPESLLNKVSWQIRNDDLSYELLDISYYIDGMDTDRGSSWGLVRFEGSTLDSISIHGLTTEDEQRLLAEPLPDAQKIIGRYISEQSGPLSGILTVYIDQGDPFMQRITKDGDISTYELSETPVTAGRRFKILVFKEDYIVIEQGPEGRLLNYSTSGLFEVAHPVELPFTPTAAAMATATPTPAPTEYVVQSGDTLRSIAQQFGTTVDDLIDANDIEDPNLIRTGATLRLPASTTAAVADATTLASASPTPTGTPAPTPGTCPTAAEAAYMLRLSEQLAIIGDAAVALGDLLMLGGENPLLFFTDNFRIAFGVQAAVLMIGSQHILDLDAPNSTQAQEIHRLSSSMARKSIDSAEALIEGIDNFDADKIEEGGQLIEEAAGYFPDMQRLLEGFCE